MFNFLKMLAISFIVLNLFGCASSVIEEGGFEGFRNVDPNKGTIYIYRESSMFGATNQYDVLVDGVLSGSLPNGSFFSVSTKPGERKIKADTGSFGKGTNIMVEKNKIYCTKLSVNFCFSCKSADITSIDNVQCKEDIESLTKVRLEEPKEVKAK